MTTFCEACPNCKNTTYVIGINTEKKSNLKVVTKKLFTWFAGNKKKANRNIYHMFLADQKNLVLQSLVEQLSTSVCVKIVDIKFKYNPMIRTHCQWYFEKGLLKFK